MLFGDNTAQLGQFNTDSETNLESLRKALEGNGLKITREKMVQGNGGGGTMTRISPKEQGSLGVMEALP